MTQTITSSRQVANAKPGNSLHRRHYVGLLFVLPAVLFTFVFFVIPLAMTVFMSLNDWPLLGQHKWIGLANYATLLNDKQFWGSLLFTTRYTLFITPAIFIFAFLLALLVNLPLRGIGFFRTAYFIPVVIGLGTSSLLWVWLLDSRVGAINPILSSIGLANPSTVWLADPNRAMVAVIVSVVWKTVGLHHDFAPHRDAGDP